MSEVDSSISGDCVKDATQGIPRLHIPDLNPPAHPEFSGEPSTRLARMEYCDEPWARPSLRGVRIKGGGRRRHSNQPAAPRTGARCAE